MRASVCRATCRRRASVCNGGHIFWLCCGPRLRGKIFPNQLIQVTAVIFKGEPWRSAHEESWGNNVLYNIIPRIRSHIWSALPGSCRRVTLPANVCSWQREEEWEFCLQYKSETWPQPKLTEQRNPESSPKKWLCHHAGADAVLFLIWINFLYRSALVLIDFTAQLKITAPIATGSLLPAVARAAGMQEALLPPCAAGMSTCGHPALGRAAALLLPTPSSSAYHPFPSWFFYTLHLFRFFFFLSGNEFLLICLRQFSHLVCTVHHHLPPCHEPVSECLSCWWLLAMMYEANTMPELQRLQKAEDNRKHCFD